MDILTEGGGLLLERDYTIIIDKSEIMSTLTLTSQKEKSLWLITSEATLAIASQCSQFDFDGLTLYLYSDDFERFDNVTVTQLTHILHERSPSGTPKLAGVLQNAIDNYFNRRLRGLAKPNGETFIVLAGSDPVDADAVKQTIIEASHQLSRDEELALSFIQVNPDAKTSKFLQTLDDDLQDMGAKFDICDTVMMEQIDNTILAEVLLNAIID
ncbi:MAG: hypothetical protein AB4426_20460 [Xenococcaceae cyanobacterium]